MLPPEADLKKIGASLAQARLKQNLSLDAIAAKTLISKRVLGAIERGELENLPEPFYTEALIKKYASVLGISNILEQETQEPEVKPSIKIAEPKKQPKTQPSIFQLRSSHLYGLYIALVIIAVRAIANFVEQPAIINTPIITEPEVALETNNSVMDSNNKNSSNSTPTTISSASPSQFVSQSNSNNAESVIVDITLKDRCWLKVMVDGRVEFEGTLPKGTERSWQGKEQINIIAGNAGGVVITYNHGQEKLLGKPGQVEEVTYTVN